MRMRLWVGVVLFCAGCVTPRERAAVEIPPWADPAGYRRIGVLPFTESNGRGRHLAEKVAANLRAQGRESLDVPALEKAFNAINPDALGLTMTQIEELRRQTGAQALLFAEVGKDSFSLILLDLQLGEEALKARFGPRAGGYPEEEILRLAMKCVGTQNSR